MTAAEQSRFYIMLGQQIRKARKKAGLTQDTFASFIKLSRASIINIEKGRQHPSIHLLLVIAKTLNIQVTDLLPNFTISETIDPKWKKIINKQIKGDKKTEEKILGFLEEVQISQKS